MAGKDGYGIPGKRWARKAGKRCRFIREPGSFLAICIFAQQRVRFRSAVEVFSRVCSLCSCSKPHIEQISVPAPSRALKKAQQAFNFSLRVDKNSKLPFAQKLSKDRGFINAWFAVKLDAKPCPTGNFC
ncbi:hypothetical protein NE619_05475 [Anaerovorax odorimutans]|uniref:Uncharacterized protein n=1 Tax=Anaerovorax odorimutans TaxID=109327 RepID=A0ABT1RLV0_9FIRM|nr:hypothetical protein [Anaerovorax odorimutans]MCQ4636170.1 hypothetical protein [Anaerovorax odorimutans]